MKNNLHNIHDRSYKDLYSNKDVFLNLIKDTLNYGWAKDLTTDSLILVDKSYILPNYHDKESDIVYRATLGDKEVILYVLLEFQSTVDQKMPLRLFFYISEILRREVDIKLKNQKNNEDIDIPIVVPLVLYNGKEVWDAPRRFRDMSSISSYFGDEIIDFKYNIIDINNGFKAEELYELENVTAAIFLLEQKIDIVEFYERIKRIALFFDNLSKNERNVLINWLSNTLEEQLAKGSKEILLSNKKEVVNVVANNSTLLKEFEEKTKKEGKINILVKLLNKKFGSIPNSYFKKISSLNDETIDKIAEDIFDFESIEDLDKYQ